MLAMLWGHLRESMRKPQNEGGKARKERGLGFAVLKDQRSGRVQYHWRNCSQNDKSSLCPNNSGPLTLDEYNQIEKIIKAAKE
jgi:hypothetical protein